MTAALVEQETPAGVDPFVPPVGAHADAGRRTDGFVPGRGEFVPCTSSATSTLPTQPMSSADPAHRSRGRDSLGNEAQHSRLAPPPSAQRNPSN
jgi:hypothetical protein